VQFVKSLESEGSKALKYVDPDKHIQHNLHAEDGSPVARKDGAWGFCRQVLAPLLNSLSPPATATFAEAP
jgi:hypothetical protein